MSATIHVGGSIEGASVASLAGRIARALDDETGWVETVRAVTAELRTAAADKRPATFESSEADFAGLEQDLAEMGVPYRCISGSGPARVVAVSGSRRLVFELSRDGEPVAPLSAIVTAGAAHIVRLIDDMRTTMQMPPAFAIARRRAVADQARNDS